MCVYFNEGNPNVQTIDGETPLHIAVIWNRTLIVEMLLVRILFSINSSQAIDINQ